MSLRGRLVLGLAVVATTAVLAAEVAGFVVLRAWLMDGLDEQLAHFSTPRKAYQDAVSEEGFPRRFTTPGALPSDFRVYFYDSDGHLLSASLGDDNQATRPQLASTVDALGLTVGRPATVPATSGDTRWRIILREGHDGMKTVIALPLATIDGATSKILYLDGTVLAFTVTGVVLFGRWVVRLGLLPLTRMERTAQGITDGDLDLRLPDTDARTETGRLGRVLNTMLERLQGALRERETSEARLRRFVADAGHELRTPLTAIQGFAELALRHEQQSAAGRREANRLIAQNAERMGLLVDDLQLLAKLDHEPSYGCEPVDLLSLAADAVSAAALGDSGRRIDLEPLRTQKEAERDEDAEELELVEAIGDPHRLRQVVENLLSNARTHTPPGTPIHVRVGTALVAPDTGGADRPGRTSASPALAHGTAIGVLEIADAGPGLAPEEAQRVFERFYRVDRSRSRSRTHDQRGSGLGLAIAAAIAQGHGGRLELDTAPGEGCTFRLVLPGPGRA
ncbi:sensor histidine kinase [Streptomyces sp. NPDC060223]|uniref:sensor histidine kinase n=1 Tax=unclassified Streptomyces TaxID=2593676 RepID=UPI003627FFF0